MINIIVAVLQRQMISQCIPYTTSIVVDFTFKSHGDNVGKPDDGRAILPERWNRSHRCVCEVDFLELNWMSHMCFFLSIKEILAPVWQIHLCHLLSLWVTTWKKKLISDYNVPMPKDGLWIFNDFSGYCHWARHTSRSCVSVGNMDMRTAPHWLLRELLASFIILL